MDNEGVCKGRRLGLGAVPRPVPIPRKHKPHVSTSHHPFTPKASPSPSFTPNATLPKRWILVLMGTAFISSQGSHQARQVGNPFRFVRNGSHVYVCDRARGMEKQGQKRCRLVLILGPFQGHMNPMLQLATIFHSKGFSITIAHTHFNSPNSTNHPDFNFLPIADGLSDRDISSGDIKAMVSLINANCEAPLRERLAQMMECEEKSNEIGCIFYDPLMYFSEAVANHLKVPSIVLHTNSLAYGLTKAAIIPRLLAEGYIPLQETSKLQDPIPGLHPFRFKDLPISNIKALEDSLLLIANAYIIRSSSAMIWNTMDFLEQPLLAQLQQQYQVPFFLIGPLHKIAPDHSGSLLKEDNSCITWLDMQTRNSVIYVSLGSLASIDEKDLAEMAWGLANSKQPFLWVVRPGLIHGSEWIELLPEGFKETIQERGCIVKWAPQKEVLAHKAVGGFWSHCGWNSSLESICEGVPMICQPCFGDQRVNARYLSHVWKVGLQLEGELERGEIERAVKRLMVDKEGEEMRQRAKDLKEKAELCMGEGGSSYKSLNELVEYLLSF